VNTVPKVHSTDSKVWNKEHHQEVFVVCKNLKANFIYLLPKAMVCSTDFYSSYHPIKTGFYLNLFCVVLTQHLKLDMLLRIDTQVLQF
jgi:hypothetical protein